MTRLPSVSPRRLIGLKSARGLYAEKKRAVQFLAPNVFRTTFFLPSDIPTGEYRVCVYLFRGEAFLAGADAEADDRQGGLLRAASPAPRSTTLSLRPCCVALALFTGWFAGADIQKALSRLFSIRAERLPAAIGKSRPAPITKARSMPAAKSGWKARSSTFRPPASTPKAGSTMRVPSVAKARRRMLPARPRTFAAGCRCPATSPRASPANGSCRKAARRPRARSRSRRHVGRQSRVVVAADPDPFAPALQRRRAARDRHPMSRVHARRNRESCRRARRCGEGFAAAPAPPAPSASPPCRRAAGTCRGARSDEPFSRCRSATTSVRLSGSHSAPAGIDHDIDAGNRRPHLSHAGAPLAFRCGRAFWLGGEEHCASGSGAAAASSGGSPIASRISASAASARMSVRASPGTCSLLISSMIGTASGETRVSL